MDVAEYRESLKKSIYDLIFLLIETNDSSILKGMSHLAAKRALLSSYRSVVQINERAERYHSLFGDDAEIRRIMVQSEEQASKLELKIINQIHFLDELVGYHNKVFKKDKHEFLLK